MYFNKRSFLHISLTLSFLLPRLHPYHMLMSALAKNNLRCMVLNFLQPVHLITVDVNEKRVALLRRKKERKIYISWAVAFVVRKRRIELILLISRYAERLMWSVCFTKDRVASVQTPRFLTWLLKMSWLPTLKWLSSDTLALLRDPTKRASAYYQSSISRQSQHTAVNNQWMKVR